MDLIEVFQTFVKYHALNNKSVLLMVSGGVDSMVLLEVVSIVLPPEQIVVLHCNHKTRPSCDEEAVALLDICAQKGICYEVAEWNTLEKATESQWRGWRKEKAQSVFDQYNCSKILTAHHATDLVETMIHRMCKGAGPDGMSPFDISTKPFWQVPKQVLLDYAEERGLSWFEDQTNAYNGPERNRIRNQVLPVLRTINPNLEKVFVKNAKIFAAQSNYFEQEICSKFKSELTQKTVSLEILLDLSEAMQTQFLRQIAGHPSLSDIEDTLRWLQSHPRGNTSKVLGNVLFTYQNKNLSWKDRSKD